MSPTVRQKVVGKSRQSSAKAARGRGLQGRGQGSDKGPIRVAIGTSERQKKPSVTRSFNRLLPASVLSRHPAGSLRNCRALEVRVGRAEVLFEMRGRSSAG